MLHYYHSSRRQHIAEGITKLHCGKHFFQITKFHGGKPFFFQFTKLYGDTLVFPKLPNSTVTPLVFKITHCQGGTHSFQIINLHGSTLLSSKLPISTVALRFQITHLHGATTSFSNITNLHGGTRPRPRPAIHLFQATFMILSSR
jgi:hypothetical protein